MIYSLILTFLHTAPREVPLVFVAPVGVLGSWYW
jgi:hypothetical protein